MCNAIEATTLYKQNEHMDTNRYILCLFMKLFV